jgi:hypothetical protein
VARYLELLVLIRDAGIDRAQLCAILGLNPETLSSDGDNPVGAENAVTVADLVYWTSELADLLRGHLSLGHPSPRVPGPHPDPWRAASPHYPGRVRLPLQRPSSASEPAAGTSAAAWPRRRYHRPDRAQSNSRRPDQRIPQSSIASVKCQVSSYERVWHGTGRRTRRLTVRESCGPWPYCPPACHAGRRRGLRRSGAGHPAGPGVAPAQGPCPRGDKDQGPCGSRPGGIVPPARR